MRLPGHRVGPQLQALADDRETRERVSLDWRGDGLDGLFAQWQLMTYAQRSEIDQRTAQDRRGPRRRPRPHDGFASSCSRPARSGLRGCSRARRRPRRCRRYVVGFDVSRTALDEHRDGVEINLATGVATPVLLGERMPVRDFPNSTLQEFGVYATTPEAGAAG